MQILWRPLGVGFYCRSFDKSPFFLSICCFATRYKTPTVCRYVATQLDINTYGVSICCFATRYLLALRAIDICSLRSHSICCLRQRVSIAPLVVTYLALPVGQRISSALAPYRVADISSDASAAHIDVESSFETNDGQKFFVDMLLRNSIYGRVATIRYISRYAQNSICCLWQRVSIAPLLLLISRCPLGNAYRAL